MNHTRVALGMACLLAAAMGVALCPPAAKAAAGYQRACNTYNLMNNVARGAMLAAPFSVCVVRDNSNGEFAATLSIDPPHTIGIPARLHLELTRNGTAVANTPELVTPQAPLHTHTPWIRSSQGKFCATLWNHDSLGYYRVGSVCHSLPLPVRP